MCSVREGPLERPRVDQGRGAGTGNAGNLSFVLVSLFIPTINMSRGSNVGRRYREVRNTENDWRLKPHQDESDRLRRLKFVQIDQGALSVMVHLTNGLTIESIDYSSSE
jgi:hypothetical protein